MYTIKRNFEKLIQDVISAGNYAAQQQSIVTRNFKSDGSVLTRVDTELNSRLTDSIIKFFPGNRIISEENPSDPGTITNWTFTLDPVDGTDSYSQGMPGWCVAVGILDEKMVPSGAIVYAPQWGNAGGNLITLFPGESPMLNGHPLPVTSFHKTNKFQIMASSNIHRHFNFQSFKGKIRNTGSGVLNILGIMLHSEVEGTVLTPCYIWDLTASHAILLSAGLEMEYLHGEKINYTFLAKREKAEDYIIAGSEKTTAIIRDSFKEIF